ncbi:MAG: hypothetical protein ACREJM_05260, partial [Candidatus Saccharimonadales bacterium]
NIALVPDAAATRPATTQPTARIKVMSTPQDHAQGRFRFRIDRDRAVGFAHRRATVEEQPQRRLSGWGGMSTTDPSTTPIELSGSLTVDKGRGHLHLEVFNPNQPIPKWLDEDSSFPAVGKLRRIGVAEGVTRLTDQYVPLVWAELEDGGKLVRSVYYVARVFSPDQKDDYRQPPPLDRFTTPTRAASQPATLPAATRPVTAALGSLNHAHAASEFSRPSGGTSGRRHQSAAILVPQ